MELFKIEKSKALGESHHYELILHQLVLKKTALNVEIALYKLRIMLDKLGLQKSAWLSIDFRM